MSKRARGVALGEDVCFALLKPDAVFRGLVRVLLEHLEASGYHPLEFRCGRVSGRMFQLMHGLGFDHGLDHWGLNQRLYSFGPGVGVLLRADPSRAGSGSPQARLCALKGVALPEMLSAGTIRAVFGSTGRVTNLIHIPDCSAAAFREASYWFGKTRLVLVRSGQAGQQDITAPAGWTPASIAQEVEVHGYGVDRLFDPGAVRVCLRLRTSHALRKRGLVSSALGTVLEGLESALRRMGVGCLADERRRRWADVWQAERGLLETATAEAARGRNEVDAALQTVLRLFHDVDRTSRAESWKVAGRLWPVLRSLGVFTSDLERYLVETHSLYKLDR